MESAIGFGSGGNENRTESPSRIWSRANRPNCGQGSAHAGVRFSIGLPPEKPDKVLISMAAGRKCKPCGFRIVTSRISFAGTSGSRRDCYRTAGQVLDLILLRQQALQGSVRHFFERSSKLRLNCRGESPFDQRSGGKTNVFLLLRIQKFSSSFGAQDGTPQVHQNEDSVL